MAELDEFNHLLEAYSGNLEPHHPDSTPERFKDFVFTVGTPPLQADLWVTASTADEAVQMVRDKVPDQSDIDFGDLTGGDCEGTLTIRFKRALITALHVDEWSYVSSPF